MARDRNPKNRKNWQLRCRGCRIPFAEETTMAQVHEHWQREHPEIGGDVALDLAWVGRGPAPRVAPRWN